MIDDRDSISKPVQEYLRRCGLSENELIKCNMDTRLYQDLGVYGDVAESYVEVLSNHYGVDMSGFEFDDFFPPEFDGRNWIASFFLWIFPLLGYMVRRRKKYHAFTLRKLENIISVGRWS